MATIIKLPESTIKQIAAGEVIVAPVNVVKELVENSLDAGATNVRIIIEDGGLKLIEIIDNGTGIAYADAELLCQRHATSKLAHTEDISRISTFGFRGEALASVSQSADLEVSSFNMTTDKKGWTAVYKNGELCGEPTEKYMQNPGTHIRVTNLFGTNRPRKMAMIPSEGKKSITDLVIRLAIHHRQRVTMTLKEANSNDLVCILAPMDIRPCFGMFYGLETENNLMEVVVQKSDEFCISGNIVVSYKKTTTTYTQPTFILFVNDRLVVNEDIKKELLAVALEKFNLKQVIYIFYVSLKIPPSDIDVNTHPAKNTVSLRYQNEITSFLVSQLQAKLQEKTQSAQFLAPLPVSSMKVEIGKLIKAESNSQSPNGGSKMRVVSTQTGDKTIWVMASKSVCNSPNTQSVNEFRSKMSSPANPSPAKRQYDIVHTDSAQSLLSQVIFPQGERRKIKLRSVHELREIVAGETTKDGARIIKDSVFVGLFDHYRALIQHETRLYAINFKAFLKEQIYQFYLFDFGNFPPIKMLSPGNDISLLIEISLDDMRAHEPEVFGKLKKNTTKSIVEELMEHANMYVDYFNLTLEGGCITTIPSIIPEHIPNLVYLGRFLIQLINDVDYSHERKCLHKIGRLFADFYSEPPANLKDSVIQKQYHDLIVTKLYPALKSYLLIPEWLFKKENICQISDTKDLYKVFERC